MILKNPQTKSFHQMLSFLLKKLHPNLSQEEIMVEDIVTFLKYIGYPY
jgi:SMC interacting uncharacterized protein involved in chromosome segregation